MNPAPPRMQTIRDCHMALGPVDQLIHRPYPRFRLSISSARKRRKTINAVPWRTNHIPRKMRSFMPSSTRSNRIGLCVKTSTQRESHGRYWAVTRVQSRLHLVRRPPAAASSLWRNRSPLPFPNHNRPELRGSHEGRHGAMMESKADLSVQRTLYHPNSRQCLFQLGVDFEPTFNRFEVDIESLQFWYSLKCINSGRRDQTVG